MGGLCICMRLRLLNLRKEGVPTLTRHSRHFPTSVFVPEEVSVLRCDFRLETTPGGRKKFYSKESSLDYSRNYEKGHKVVLLGHTGPTSQ